MAPKPKPKPIRATRTTKADIALVAQYLRLVFEQVGDESEAVEEARRTMHSFLRGQWNVDFRNGRAKKP